MYRGWYFFNIPTSLVVIRMGSVEGVRLPMFGEHNVLNALAAIAVA